MIIMFQALRKSNTVASLLLAVCLLLTLSCAREQVTITGAESLFGKIPFVVGLDVARSVTDRERDAQTYLVLKLGL